MNLQKNVISNYLALLNPYCIKISTFFLLRMKKIIVIEFITKCKRGNCFRYFGGQNSIKKGRKYVFLHERHKKTTCLFLNRKSLASTF